jgi:ATP-dependent Clp protease adaptor protein ClpS
MTEHAYPDGGLSSEVLEDIDEEVREPDMFRVILHNDHYTTMEFVVEVIVTVFHKQVIEATKIMLDVHKKGKGMVGTYPYDIAATRRAQVVSMARAREFPLKCTIEKE